MGSGASKTSYLSTLEGPSGSENFSMPSRSEIVFCETLEPVFSTHRLSFELSKPLDASDIEQSGPLRSSNMLEEVQRLRSLIRLADSSTRGREHFESLEDIHEAISRARNEATDKQRIQLREKRKQKRESTLRLLNNNCDKVDQSELDSKGAMKQSMRERHSTISASHILNPNASSMLKQQPLRHSTGSLLIRKRSVVIVEDSPVFMLRLKRLLKRVCLVDSGMNFGLDIITFSNAQAAETYLNKSTPTLVFMDNIFPSDQGGNCAGIDLCHRLHGSSRGDLRVILMSGGALECVGHYGQLHHKGFPDCVIGMLPKSTINARVIHHACRVNSISVRNDLPQLPQRRISKMYVRPDNFHFITTLAQGSFSIILLAQLLKRSSKEGNEEHEQSKIEDTKLHAFPSFTSKQVSTAKIAADESNLAAVKVIQREEALNRLMVEPLRREIDLLLRLNHPHIVQLEGWCMDARRVYMFFEYCPGGDVLGRIERAGQKGGICRVCRQMNCSCPSGANALISETSAKYWISELLDVLSYLHEKGIMHRDVKPENLLITASGHVKLCDFGFAKHIGFGRTYTNCGSPEYVAPEIILNKGHGLPADSWSFGVTMYEIIAGHLPWFDQNSSDADLHPLYLTRAICEAKYVCEDSCFSLRARSVLKQVLCVEPNDRVDMHNLKKDAWFEGCFMSENPNSRHILDPISYLPSTCEKLRLIKSWNRITPQDLIPFLASDNDTRYKAFVGETIEGLGSEGVEILGERESRFKGFYVDEQLAKSVQKGAAACG